MSLQFRTEMRFAYGEPSELAPGVVRFVANNPSPYTFKGTNTYVLGSSSLVVIDPGPDDAAHIAAIVRFAADRPITDILITHTHRDHTDGLPRLQALTGARTAGWGPYQRTSRVAADAVGGETTTAGQPPFQPDVRLSDGDRFEWRDGSLTAVHTPGHLPDHLCFALEGTGILFSGDHVMGWNTSVVAPPDGRMGDYNRSLEKLLARSGDALYLPGHGGRIEQPQRVAKAYLIHRRMREQAILDAIHAGARRIDQVVARVYEGLDPRLVPAAAMSVLAHVEHLEERGLLRPSPSLTLRSELQPV
jgi:glyoxylase-like metal-dependent hydrolase (beta-lactamase superfamily II)